MGYYIKFTRQGYNVFKAIDSIIAEKQRLFVAFNCKPETTI